MRPGGWQCHWDASTNHGYYILIQYFFVDHFITLAVLVVPSV